MQKKPKLRARRIVEAGGWRGKPVESDGRGITRYETEASLILARLKKAAHNPRESRIKRTYIGIDQAAVPGLRQIRDESGRTRLIVNWRNEKAPEAFSKIRRSSVDVIHFHMLKENFSSTEMQRMAEECSRILRTGGILFLTEQTNIMHPEKDSINKEKLMAFYRTKLFRIRSLAVRPIEIDKLPKGKQIAPKDKDWLYAGFHSVPPFRHPKKPRSLIEKMSVWGPKYGSIIAILEKRKERTKTNH
ncbi:MAG: hypothetical protein AABX02_01685 [archaeon]